MIGETMMTDGEWAQLVLREMGNRNRHGSVQVDYQRYSCGDGVNFQIWDEETKKICRDADRDQCYLKWTAYLQQLQEVTNA